MKVYIAAPFFNPTQLAIVKAIKTVLKENDMEYFSPKDESMFKQGDDPKQIINLNCLGVRMSDAVIAVTDGKDVGTMFECGYAYSHQIPILYLWLHRKEGQAFNLMLAASGSVVHKISDIPEALKSISLISEYYDGLIE
jgi:nucleoside 2-deoxyribosyltransferase